MRGHLPGQCVHGSGMAEESGIDVEHAVEKRRQHGGILIGSAQAFEQRGGRLQFLALEILGHMRGQGAVGAVEQDARLALDQQAQLGQFVFEDRSACHQSDA